MPRNVYSTLGPIRGHLVVRKQGNIDIEIRASEWRKVVGPKSSRRWYILGLTEQRLEGLMCC